MIGEIYDPTRHSGAPPDERAPSEATVGRHPRGLHPTEVTWHHEKGALRVFLGGREVLAADGNQIENGHAVLLPDGRVLSVHNKPVGLVHHELQILLDGEPVPGSDSHPGSRVRSAAKWIAIAATYYVLMSVVALATGERVMLTPDEALVGLAFGVALAPLAFLAYRRSLAGLIIATLLMAAEFVVRLLYAPGADLHCIGVLIRLSLLSTLVVAIGTVVKRRYGAAGTNSSSGFR